jgi:hypothetical protein
MQGIGGDDASFDPHWRQELRDNREFVLLLSHHLLFEHQPGARLIERHLMHLALIGGLMPQRPTERLAIEGHMHMRCAFGLPDQTARFVSTALHRPYSRQQLRDHLVHLLGIERL